MRPAMTDAQTEARAIVSAALPPHEQAMLGGDAIVVLADLIATALAAKDAELIATRQELGEMRLVLEQTERNADRIAVHLAEARKALEQIERKICAAEHGHTINDVLANYREVRRTVQDARAARRALEGGKVE